MTDRAAAVLGRKRQLAPSGICGIIYFELSPGLPEVWHKDPLPCDTKTGTDPLKPAGEE
jgi:hypothetical protein